MPFKKFIASGFILILQFYITVSAGEIENSSFEKNSYVNHILDTLLPQLESMITAIQISDIVREDIVLHNIKIVKFKIIKENIDISLSEGKVFFDARNIDITLDLNYKVSKSIFSTSGHLFGEASDIEISAGIKLEANSEKKVVPKFYDLDFNIGELEIRLDGDLISSILSLIKDIFKTQIQSVLQVEIKKAILAEAPSLINKAVIKTANSIRCSVSDFLLRYLSPEVSRNSNDRIEL